MGLDKFPLHIDIVDRSQLSWDVWWLSFTSAMVLCVLSPKTRGDFTYLPTVEPVG